MRGLARGRVSVLCWTLRWWEQPEPESDWDSGPPNPLSGSDTRQSSPAGRGHTQYWFRLQYNKWIY